MLIHKGRLRANPESDDSDDDVFSGSSPERVPARLPTSQIYPRDPARYWQQVVPKRQGPKQAKDRLLDLLRDEQYHHAGEMEALLPDGDWVAAVRELVDVGYFFERRGDSFKIRYLREGETRQRLAPLLAGVDASKYSPEVAVPRTRELVAQPEAPDSEDFDPVAGEPFVGDQLPSDAMDVSATSGELPLSAGEFATGTHAILARKGYGKSYLGMVLVEELTSCSGAPALVIDPMGVWAPGLRSMADGSPSPFQCVTFGGQHADVEITRGQGAAAADAVKSYYPCSTIVDLSQFSPEEQHEFVADLLGRLFVVWDRSPLHVLVDEADEFAPQSLQGTQHQKRALANVDRLVRRGRTKGFGSTMITQRPAVLNKNVLTQADGVFVLHVIAPPDLAAVDEWLRFAVDPGRRADCIRALPSLPVGHAYFLRGGTTPMFSRFVTRKRKTFDSSRTPRPGETSVEPQLALPPADALSVARRVVLGCSENSPEEDRHE